MNDLQKIILKDNRVIEFRSTKRFTEHDLLSGELFLPITRSRHTEDDPSVGLSRADFIRAIKNNSSDVIVLDCAGWSELKALQNTAEAHSLFERITLFNFMFLIYFLAKGIVSGRQKYVGLFYIRRGKRIDYYIGIKRIKIRDKAARRYLSPIVGMEDFFRCLNEKKITYCILRWFEDLPNLDLKEDVDIMVDDDDLESLYSIIERRPGIVPFDIYSKSGMHGSDFKGLPYYVFSLAEKTLCETILHHDTYKVPTWENYFMLLAYHSVFHKGENSGLNSKKYDLTVKNQPDHDYLYHLKRVLSKTDLFVEDFTLEGLHAFLEEKGYVPPLDTQYKLSIDNQYLKAHLHDLHSRSDLFEKYKGLVCFVAREKILEAGLFEDLKKFIHMEGFTILRTVEIENSFKDVFVKRVRGGNWCRGPWPSSGGLPAVLLVALDVYPVEPEPGDHQKHPGLTNRRIQMKEEIRDSINDRLPDKMDWFNGIHSSDNEIQAVEYLSLAGLDKDEICKEIKKQREIFNTEYPVIQVMSQISRRAKVELILYKGKKAVKKTFKPKCEWALENEIKAHRVFQDIVNIPKLLEMGTNYMITSYLEGSKPLRKRIGIRTLKRCLFFLRKIYDCGYSILDFKPGNFLLDKNEDIYMIDFEFLYEYHNKPSFMECYDLCGTPQNIDFLHVPARKIPEGEKLFDILWADRTGISYEELYKLDDFRMYFNSFYHYYWPRIIRKFFTFKENGINAMKAIQRALP